MSSPTSSREVGGTRTVDVAGGQALDADAQASQRTDQQRDEADARQHADQHHDRSRPRRAARCCCAPPGRRARAGRTRPALRRRARRCSGSARRRADAGPARVTSGSPPSGASPASSSRRWPRSLGSSDATHRAVAVEQAHRHHAFRRRRLRGSAARARARGRRRPDPLRAAAPSRRPRDWWPAPRPRFSTSASSALRSCRVAIQVEADTGHHHQRHDERAEFDLKRSQWGPPSGGSMTERRLRSPAQRIGGVDSGSTRIRTRRCRSR